MPAVNIVGWTGGTLLLGSDSTSHSLIITSCDAIRGQTTTKSHEACSFHKTRKSLVLCTAQEWPQVRESLELDSIHRPRRTQVPLMKRGVENCDAYVCISQFPSLYLRRHILKAGRCLDFLVERHQKMLKQSSLPVNKDKRAL